MCVSRICCCNATMAACIGAGVTLIFVAIPGVVSWGMAFYIVWKYVQSSLVTLSLLSAICVFIATCAKVPALMYVAVALQILPTLFLLGIGIYWEAELSDFYETVDIVLVAFMYGVPTVLSIFSMYAYFCGAKQLYHDREVRKQQKLELQMLQLQLHQQQSPPQLPPQHHGQHQQSPQMQPPLQPYQYQSQDQYQQLQREYQQQELKQQAIRLQQQQHAQQQMGQQAQPKSEEPWIV
ncbi:hypothetical protein PMAYCL1PPCAC_19629 [Pristionchus mayeri]|uniref:Uncharacterized protein n=1 Tax=Pristionchus mayeri TaxID=1317129 RepID=A0AAN5CS93_9BILA|nr:hypothetical protein PMAYCL1PPCAC_19629 [Pristionchus mayeri]